MESSTTEPEWNEQISFIEMFPPLAKKIKIQVLDDANVGDVAIATHYIDLQQISDPSRNGEAWHGCSPWGRMLGTSAQAMVVSWSWKAEVHGQCMLTLCDLGCLFEGRSLQHLVFNQTLSLQALTPRLALPGGTCMALLRIQLCGTSTRT